MIQGMVISLVLTILIEGIFGFLWGLRGRNLYLLVLVNCLTNPVVVLLNYRFGWILPTELSAIVVEALLYRFLGDDISHPWLFSFSVNLFSYCTGMLLVFLI